MPKTYAAAAAVVFVVVAAAVVAALATAGPCPHAVLHSCLCQHLPTQSWSVCPVLPGQPKQTGEAHTGTCLAHSSNPPGRKLHMCKGGQSKGDADD
jgi:hypothetical protein